MSGARPSSGAASLDGNLVQENPIIFRDPMLLRPRTGALRWQHLEAVLRCVQAHDLDPAIFVNLDTVAARKREIEKRDEARGREREKEAGERTFSTGSGDFVTPNQVRDD